MNDLIIPYLIETEPYYRAQGDEIGIFSAAIERGLPMMVKGPT